MYIKLNDYFIVNNDDKKINIERSLNDSILNLKKK